MSDKRNPIASKLVREFESLKQAYVRLIDFAHEQAKAGALTDRDSESLVALFHLCVGRYRHVEPTYPEEDIIPRGPILAALNRNPELTFEKLSASAEDIAIARKALSAVTEMLEHWLPGEKHAITAAMRTGASRG